MNKQIDRLVLMTNGHHENRPSLEYGLWLAKKLNLPVLVLGVQEPHNQDHPVSSLVEEMIPSMRSASIEYQVDYFTGQAETLVHHVAWAAGDLVVFGPLGRPWLHNLFLGQPFRRLMEELHIPILFVPRACLPIRKVLVCMGGLGYALDVFRVALSIAAPLKASMTFLHVVEPVTLSYPLAREVEAHWQDLLNTNTPQGRMLKQVVKETQELEINAEVKMRQGHIVPEIINEIETENYDLVCMGSTYSASSLRHLTLPNVTAEIAEAAGCPILAVRTSQVEPAMSALPILPRLDG
jgi:nucleotide-binding universal stress UspA family protein